MSKNKELLKNTFIIFLGTISTKLISFLLLPLYTGILSPKEYGIVDLFNTLIMILIPILSLKTEEAAFRYLIDYRGDFSKEKRIITTTFCFNLFNTIVYLLVLLVCNSFISNGYVLFFAFGIFCCNFFSLLLQYSRGLGDNLTYSISSFISAIVTIVFNIIFLTIFKLNAIGMILGAIIGYFVGSIYMIFKLKLPKYLSLFQFSVFELKKLLTYSVPLIANALSWWIFSSSDRVIVSSILGLSANGILSISYKFSSIFIVLYNIFNTSWTESISLHINDSDVEAYFNNIFDIVFKLFFSFGLCIIAFMPIIFKIMINSKYIYAYNLIPFMMIASIFQVVVGLVSVVYLAKNNTKSIAFSSILAAIINIVINLSLIKYIGLYAAAISTFVSYFIFALYRFTDINRKYIKINIDCFFVFSSLIVLLLILIFYYSNYTIIKILGMLLSLVYFILLNKKSIFKFINYFKNKKILKLFIRKCRL